METYFAPAEVASEQRLQEQIEIFNQSSLMEGLMETVGGLLAVLNEERQIISLNRKFLKMLGIQDPMEALGLRTGNVMHCIHADESPAGCGTTKFCSTCGAGKSIMASIEQNEPVEDTFILKAMTQGRESDLVLKVKSHPVNIENTRFILLFLRDITIEQQRAALERTFFHDINNMLSGLVGASEILARENNKSPMVDIVRRSSMRLQKAVEIQRFLLASETDSFQLTPQPISLDRLKDDLLALFMNHPATESKQLIITHDLGDLEIQTDVSLFQRVLANMITNALEATEPGGTVEVNFYRTENVINFSVHNDHVIPDEIKLRIFQRNFSTKATAGRGIGTFSMKLFGEKILGGKVNFTSTREAGTIFTFSLPLNQSNLVNQYS